MIATSRTLARHAAGCDDPSHYRQHFAQNSRLPSNLPQMELPRRISAALCLGFTISASAQELEGIQVTSPPCEPFTANVTVFFPFGFGQNCPALTGYTVQPGDVTAFIDLYYDVSGIWMQVGCWSTATVDEELPPGMMMVNLRTHQIMDGDTSAVIADTVLNVCTITGIADGNSSLPTAWVQGDELRWQVPENPRSGKLHIFAYNGQAVRTTDTEAGSCRIDGLAPGCYFARWPNGATLRFFRP